MNIEAFHLKQSQLTNALDWFALYDKSYSGGGGGTGEFVNPHITLTIYHQAYDGATNYHDAPKELQFYLKKQIEKCSHLIAAQAIAEMKEDLKKLAELAKAEAEEILRLAKGVTTEIVTLAVV